MKKKESFTFNHFEAVLGKLVLKSFPLDYVVIVPEGSIMVGTNGELAWNTRKEPKKNSTGKSEWREGWR